uniref:Uncharacterized protein n=1 Tax=Caenorhabditis japonica TaxID=281687 RepID=A0A8R1DGZ2_CAEJA
MANYHTCVVYRTLTSSAHCATFFLSIASHPFLPSASAIICKRITMRSDMSENLSCFVSKTVLCNEEATKVAAETRNEQNWNRVRKYRDRQRKHSLEPTTSSQPEVGGRHGPSNADSQPTEVPRGQEKKVEIPERSIDCKIRIGCIDPLRIEIQHVVIPLYGDANPRTSIHEKFKRIVSKEVRHGFEAKMQSAEWKNKMRNYEPQTFKCRGPADCMFEIYISCFVQCDKMAASNAAIPIMGHGLPVLKCAAIALQTVYAYMQITTNKNWNLIYLLIDDGVMYDKIGSLMSYIREIDLNSFTREQFSALESEMFNALEPKVLFATIHGTDMVWRSFPIRGVVKKRKEMKQKL